MTAIDDFRPVYHTLITEGEFKGNYTPNSSVCMPGSLFAINPHESMATKLMLQESMKLMQMGLGIVTFDPKGDPDHEQEIHADLTELFIINSDSNESRNNLMLLEHLPNG